MKQFPMVYVQGAITDAMVDKVNVILDEEVKQYSGHRYFAYWDSSLRLVQR